MIQTKGDAYRDRSLQMSRSHCPRDAKTEVSVTETANVGGSVGRQP